ncbi:type 2 lanthipeptide synthetase LanM [Staphylococcus hominis]|uniref:type 2 lanthipeptide synthetase LanM n=1 Tax=Staphylococcus hominis TaxID=1290 RepID=UPI0028782E1E|nr:type 2 lanthipeptide synthetase LanM [Staphylococcus hominis]MDS3898914.1 type 2 lanthipeptide synthetase LanM [Staphylococcus hominis]
MLDNLYKAMTLDERYEAIVENDKSNNYIMDRRAFQLWRANHSILSDTDFNKMMKIKNYNPDLFSIAIQYNPSEQIQEYYNDKLLNLSWYKFRQKVLESSDKRSSEYNYTPNDELSYLFIDFLNYSYKTLLNYIDSNNISFLQDKKQFVHSIVEQLETRLSIFSKRTLVLDINIKRIEGSLNGDTPEERFEDYIKNLDFQRKDIYNNYPVLLRSISISTMHFVDFICEVLSHIHEDWDAISNEFQELGTLNKMVIDAGDTHNFGRTVCKMKFENTTLIYKPKNLKINLSYKKFVDSINAISEKGKIFYPKTLCVNNHAYEEYIKYRNCKNSDELRTFYYNFGFVMGLVYFLNGTDMHMENLIADSFKPTIVDLETLIQQPLASENKDSYTDEIISLYFHRINRTLFLTDETRTLANKGGLDLSAINGRFKKEMIDGLKLTNTKRDDIKFINSKFDLPSSNNLPYIHKTELVNYNEYKNEILEGFSELSKILLDNKDYIQEKLDTFKNVTTRILVRDTSQYDSIIKQIHHPDLLENMLDQEKILENMWGLSVANKQLINSECTQLRNLDIPIFFMNSSKNYVVDPLENKIKDIYDDIPLNYLKYCLNNVNDSYINKQKSFISIQLSGFDKDNRQKYMNRDLSKSMQINSYDLISEAEKIGDTIIKNSIFISGRYEWFIPVNIKNNSWSTQLMKSDIYEGKSGILLFFYHLSRYSSQKRYSEFYINLLNEFVKYESINNPVYGKLGLSSELGYFLAFSLIEDYGPHKLNIRKYITKIISSLENNINTIDLDYINGDLPIIPALIRIYERFNNNNALALSLKFFNLLIDQLKKYTPKYGFGHGIFSIYHVYKIIKPYLTQEMQSRFLLQYRQLENGLVKVDDIKWCNGIVGKYALNPFKFKEEIENLNLLHNDSLCHGNMGILDLSTSANSKTNIKFLSYVLNSKNENNSFMLNDTESIQNTSLYTGLSGIGYEILRIYDSEHIPSLLTL